jgi:hypothetical protein
MTCRVAAGRVFRRDARLSGAGGFGVGEGVLDGLALGGWLGPALGLAEGDGSGVALAGDSTVADVALGAARPRAVRGRGRMR